ncbi:MAG TPA: HIT family protein [Acidimicrobiales bacterium]|nr:HIT family protein [Acidimicrobiales bacterium]
MPLLVPDADCSFCAYLSGMRPYTILERSEQTAILVTFEQRGVGHVLVIPIEHRRTILELEPDESASLMITAARAARAIDAAYQPQGIAVWQNNGTPANQTVPHVHIHVAATLPGGGTNWGEVERLSIAETNAIADRLREHLPPA